MKLEKIDIGSIIEYAEKHYNAKEEEILEFFTQCYEILDYPFSLNDILQDFIGKFEIDQIEANKFYGSRRLDFIKYRYYFLLFFINDHISDKTALNDIIGMYRPFMIEQFEYWKNELCVLPDNNEKIKKFDANFKLELIETNFIHFSDKIKNSENTKFTLSQETKLLIYDLLIMLGNVNDFYSNAQIEKVNSIVYDSLVNIKEYLSEENDIQYINNFISMFEIDSNPEKNSKKKHLLFTKQSPLYLSEQSEFLMNYLIENYVEVNKKKFLKRRFSNLWYFMKKDNNKKNYYKFYFTLSEYKRFVKENFDIEIKNTDKAEKKYSDEKIKLNGLVLEYEALYKSE